MRAAPEIREWTTLHPAQVAAMTLDEVIEATRQHAIEIGHELAGATFGDLDNPVQLIAFGVTSTLLLGRSTALLAQLRALSDARQTAQTGGA